MVLFTFIFLYFVTFFEKINAWYKLQFIFSNNPDHLKWRSLVVDPLSCFGKAKGWFELTSMNTLWIVRHKVQLIINHIINKIWGRKSYVEKLTLCSIGFTNSGKIARKNPFKWTWLMRKWHRCRITGIQFQEVVIGMGYWAPSLQNQSKWIILRL